MVIVDEHSFSDLQDAAELYPIYKNSFCDNFTYFMNCVFLRNDKNALIELQHNFFGNLNIYSQFSKDKYSIEEYFTIIDKYGTMTNES